MKTILVPFDFSKCAQNALRLATQLARKTEAQVYISHIVEPAHLNLISGKGENSYGLVLKYFEHVKGIVLENIEKILQSPDYEGVKFQKFVEQGSIHKTLLHHISTLEVDLVVMGTHGVGGLDELWVGSRTERIVRYSPVPVLTVRKLDNDFNIQKIVLAINLEDKQIETIKKVKRIQALFAAHVQLLYVNKLTGFYGSQEIHQRLDVLAANAQLDNYSTHYESAYNEEQGILNFAKRENADLIALATHQRNGLSHLLAGSITENIVNHTADIPVLACAIV
ncbi:MAG: universal stress protein [Microscillaceae bacterium]|jgi:nucleotide-binding universal stress UspA family protein|nr:universal stress protein [Microscillaceae bacterium]